MAIATDHNPGTSPTTSLLLMLNMAATLFRLDGAGSAGLVVVHWRAGARRERAARPPCGRA